MNQNLKFSRINFEICKKTTIRSKILVVLKITVANSNLTCSTIHTSNHLNGLRYSKLVLFTFLEGMVYISTENTHPKLKKHSPNWKHTPQIACSAITFFKFLPIPWIKIKSFVINIVVRSMYLPIQITMNTLRGEWQTRKRLCLIPPWKAQ